MNALSDIELWLLVKQEDATAFETLYNRYWEQSYKTCYWHLLDQESAKDIVQELFVDLWVKREQINITETLEGYIKVALRNRVFNHIRSLNTKKKHNHNAAVQAPVAGSEVQERYSEKELRQLYLAEIGKLPDKMKDVFTLNKEEGYSISEVAQKLSLSEQTVKNQLSNALKRIRSGLEHYRIVMILLGIYLYIFFNAT